MKNIKTAILLDLRRGWVYKPTINGIVNKSLLLILTVLLSSCNMKKNTYSLEKDQEIVDYTDASISASRRFSSYNDKTIFIYKEKEISRKQFNKLADREKVKSLQSISDKDKIEEMGFSFAEEKE